MWLRPRWINFGVPWHGWYAHEGVHRAWRSARPLILPAFGVVDRRHPHNFVDEMAVFYIGRIGGGVLLVLNIVFSARALGLLAARVMGRR